MKLLKRSTYNRLKTDLAFYKDKYFNLNDKFNKNSAASFLKIQKLEQEKEKYKDFYDLATSEGFNAIDGGEVLKIFKLRVEENLPLKAKDITFLGNGEDNEGHYFLYSALVWKSNKENKTIDEL